MEDFGDTMAAVQGLLKKHDAFETDFAVHRDRCEQISNGGIDLADSKNHHADSILQRCQQLQVSHLKIFNLNIINKIVLKIRLSWTIYLPWLLNANLS